MKFSICESYTKLINVFLEVDRTACKMLQLDNEAKFLILQDLKFVHVHVGNLLIIKD